MEKKKKDRMMLPPYKIGDTVMIRVHAHGQPPPECTRADFKRDLIVTSITWVGKDRCQSGYLVSVRFVRLKDNEPIRELRSLDADWFEK